MHTKSEKLIGFPFVEVPPQGEAVVEFVAQFPCRVRRIEFRRSSEGWRHLRVEEMILGREILGFDMSARQLSTTDLPRKTRLLALQRLAMRLANPTDAPIRAEAIARVEEER